LVFNGSFNRSFLGLLREAGADARDGLFARGLAVYVAAREVDGLKGCVNQGMLIATLGPQFRLVQEVLEHAPNTDVVSALLLRLVNAYLPT